MTNIAVAQACNLRCPYCFAEGAMARNGLGKAGTFISLDAFQDRLDLLERSGIGEARLIGGEPTLHPQFPELVRLARLRNLRVVVFSRGLMPETALAALEALPVETCGVLVNVNASHGLAGPTPREGVRRLRTLQRLGLHALPGFTIYRPDFELAGVLAAVEQTGCQPIIRYGAPTTHDQQRPFVSGRGSAAIVLRSIAALDHQSFSYGIRMTATAPWERLPEDVRFLCEQTACRSIQVEPAFNTARGGHDQGEASDYQAFAAAFMDAYEIAQRAHRVLFYSGARLGQVAATFCRAPYDALIVTPGDDLVACYEVTTASHPMASLSVIGRCADGEINPDTRARSRLHGLMAERQARCRECFCYRSCAGDCYTRGFDVGPAGHLTRGPRCQLNQDLTRSLLLTAIAAGGGVWRCGRPSGPAVAQPARPVSPACTRSRPPVRSSLVVTSWWSNSLALACLHRLAAQGAGRGLYVVQAGKSPEQMARFRALLPPGVVELDYPGALPQDDSRMREYLALTLLRDLSGAWFVDHDLFFQAECEPWFAAADDWFSQSRTCLSTGEPRDGPGVTQPAYWLSPARWPQRVVSFDPVPYAEKTFARRPDLHRHNGDLVMPQKDTLVRAKEELQVRGLASWFPLAAEAATRHGLPAFPAHTHLGGLHLYTGPIPAERFRPWMEHTVAQFDRFFDQCPPAWLEAEEPELLRRHREFKAALK